MKDSSYKEFVDEYGLKEELTNNMKIQQTLNELHPPTKVHMRDDTFSTDSGIDNLHPTKGTRWVMFTNQNYFDSYGCPPPTNIENQVKIGIYSEYQIQKDDSYCAAYYMFCILHKLNYRLQKCSFKFILSNFQT